MFSHFSALAFILAPLMAMAQSAPPGTGIDLSALDRSVDACSDFYHFACGGWIALNPLPADRQRYGQFTEVLERNNTVLRRIWRRRAVRAICARHATTMLPA